MYGTPCLIGLQADPSVLLLWRSKLIEWHNREAVSKLYCTSSYSCCWSPVFYFWEPFAYMSVPQATKLNVYIAVPCLSTHSIGMVMDLPGIDDFYRFDGCSVERVKGNIFFWWLFSSFFVLFFPFLYVVRAGHKDIIFRAEVSCW